MGIHNHGLDYGSTEYSIDSGSSFCSVRYPSVGYNAHVTLLISDHISLSFVEKPKVSLAQQEVTIDEKETISLDCFAREKPTPIFTWKFLRDIPRK